MTSTFSIKLIPPLPSNHLRPPQDVPQSPPNHPQLCQKYAFYAKLKSPVFFLPLYALGSSSPGILLLREVECVDRSSEPLYLRLVSPVFLARNNAFFPFLSFCLRLVSFYPRALFGGASIEERKSPPE